MMAQRKAVELSDNTDTKTKKNCDIGEVVPESRCCVVDVDGLAGELEMIRDRVWHFVSNSGTVFATVGIFSLLARSKILTKRSV